MKKSSLLNLIRELREEMEELAKSKGFNNQKVLDKSQELDKLLNEYEKLIKDSWLLKLKLAPKWGFFLFLRLK